MPREARRKRRSLLPSAIERNLSLEELLGEEESSKKKKERQEKEQQALQLMASVPCAHVSSLHLCFSCAHVTVHTANLVLWQYFSMIDSVELQVEDASSSATASNSSGSESSPAKSCEETQEGPEQFVR